MFARIANVKLKAHKLAQHKTQQQSQVKLSRRHVTIKEAHFDEENLTKTKPKTKDYGLLAITESKTPYPRKEEPVDATLLRDRLVEMSHTPSITSADIDFYAASTASSHHSAVSSSSSGEVLTFDELRRKFNRAEFTITRQRDMRNVPHKRGEVISADLTRASIFV